MNKNKPLLAALLLGAVAAPVAALVYLYRRPLPQVNGRLHVAGLRAPVEIIRDRWGEMLDKGATTTWETFRGWAEDLMYGMWTRSWGHAWSSAPAYFLSRYILGVLPLEPGFKRALIAPKLCDLTWVEGKAPTPHGAIDMP